MLQSYKVEIWFASTHICSSREYSFRCEDLLNFADASIFLQIYSVFQKIVPVLKSNSMRAVLEIFSSVFSWCKMKGYYSWKCKYYRRCVHNPASGLLHIGHKLGKWNDFEVCRYKVILSFFDDVAFFLSSLFTVPSYMSVSLLVLELWQFSFIKDWQQTYNHVHNILRLFDGWAIFLSPQVKRSVIISNKLVYMGCLTSCRTT